MPSCGTLYLLQSQSMCTCLAQEHVCSILGLQGFRTHTACKHAWPLAWGRHRLLMYLPHDICWECAAICRVFHVQCRRVAWQTTKWRQPAMPWQASTKSQSPNGCTVAACGRYPNEVTASCMTSPASLSMAVFAMTEWSCERMRCTSLSMEISFQKVVLLEFVSEESERPVLTSYFKTL
jgi:hypothetical protein